jgi:hypothetical protein
MVILGIRAVQKILRDIPQDNEERPLNGSALSDRLQVRTSLINTRQLSIFIHFLFPLPASTFFLSLSFPPLPLS